LLSGTIGDLVWSDFASYVEDTEDSPRGCGQVYGLAPTADFMSRCGFTQIIRSHEFTQNGADWVFGPEIGCLTVFSSADYQERVNDGAFAKVGPDGKVDIVTFPPLFGNARKRFKVLSPSWLIESPDIADWHSAGSLPEDRFLAVHIDHALDLQLVL
jgi:hypothetical protein